MRDPQGSIPSVLPIAKLGRGRNRRNPSERPPGLFLSSVPHLNISQSPARYVPQEEWRMVNIGVLASDVPATKLATIESAKSGGKEIRTAVEHAAASEHGTEDRLSVASGPNPVTPSSEGPEGSKVSTERVDCEGNETATYEDNRIRGNGSVAPETPALDHSRCIDLGIRETAGFAAVGFLTFSVCGYVGFVLWRRYLQSKYGNGQTLITEDVYDVTDLRHFEI